MTDKPSSKRKLKQPQSVREKVKQSKATISKPKKKSKLKKVILARFNILKKILVKYKAFRILSKIFNFIGLIIVPKYLRSSWDELKLVTWPNRRESIRLSYAVLAFAVVFGALVAALDYGLNDLFKIILLGK
jgi:preprotein translocase SecE subunit